MKQYVESIQLKELSRNQQQHLADIVIEKIESKEWSAPEVKVCVISEEESSHYDVSLDYALFSILKNTIFLPLLSIGQMIEILDENWKTGKKHVLPSISHDRPVNRWQIDGEKNFSDSELCDALWEAVKESLVQRTAIA